MMEKIINLPTVEAVMEFVKKTEETGETVLVSKEGFNYQIDGASFIGMMNIIGANIIVRYAMNSRKYNKMLEHYQVG